jgi:hypothetical protein
MSNKDKAKSFLEDLLDDDSDLAQEIAESEEPVTPDVQFIVYYLGDNPETVWEYHHNPEDGAPILNADGTPELDENGKPLHKGYGRLHGYWDADKEEKVSRHFVKHVSNNLKLMDFDTFMDRVVPNKDCTKIFNSEADFLLELI